MTVKRSRKYFNSTDPVRMEPQQARAFTKALAESGFKTFDNQMIFADGCNIGVSRCRSTLVRRNDLPDGSKVELGMVLTSISFNNHGSSFAIEGGMIQVAPFSPGAAALVKAFRDRQHFGIDTPDEGLIYAAVVAAANLAEVKSAVEFHNEFTGFIETITRSNFPRIRAFMQRFDNSVLDGIVDRDMSKLPSQWKVQSIYECPSG